MRSSLTASLRAGSSPLARGTERVRRAANSLGRFIPAGAGNSNNHRSVAGQIAVHPRWRGEQGTKSAAAARNCGSSPLARGTAVEARHHFPCSSVHPRWRGEQQRGQTVEFLVFGSSPLARGTGCSGRVSCQGLRFIPAGAGNSGERPKKLAKISVHPRWRGEQAIAGHDFRHGFRFIPAGAGNRARYPGDCDHPAVHPRWRGEQVCEILVGLETVGSSPLARGTVVGMPRAVFPARFIPAGAGNSLAVFLKNIK